MSLLNDALRKRDKELDPDNKTILMENDVTIEKTGKTKTAVILEAVDEKLGNKKTKSEAIRELAGWMSKDETDNLRNAISVFDQINEEDWE